ncbi:MAG: hypothetical protein ACI3V5_09005 [Faecousia sp.]
MTQKPKIQYIGQFYVPGSEAQVLAPKQKKKKAKTKLPAAKREKIEAIYIDPVALIGLTVAVVMLTAMVLGALQIRNDWARYEAMSQYVSELNHDNAKLEYTYRSGYDLDDVREKALAIGMVPVEELESRSISVTVPQREPEPTLWDDIVWFFSGLFA